MSDLLTRDTSPSRQAPLGRPPRPTRGFWLAAILAALVAGGVVANTGSRNQEAVPMIGDTRAEAIVEHRAALGGGRVEPTRDDRAEAISEHRAALGGGRVEPTRDDRAEAISEHREAVGGGKIEPTRDDRAEAISEHRQSLAG